jgi:uncharacterized membrane protein required for colicin V production
MIANISYLDFALILVPLLFGLLGMWWGLTAAALSLPVRLLLSWWIAVAAVFATTPAVALSSPWIGKGLQAPAALVQVVAATLILLCVFVGALSLLERVRARVLKSASPVSWMGRVGGLIFGIVASGLLLHLLLAVAYLRLEAHSPNPQHHPLWLRQSVSLPAIQGTSAALRFFFLRVHSKP